MKFFGRANKPIVSLKMVIAKSAQKNQKIKFNVLFDDFFAIK